MRTLEERYRRLLGLYPAGQRREMLDVLLDAARPGQTRPSAADTADLLVGAVRLHLRRAVAGRGAPVGWPAALSIAGFVALAALLADGLRFAANIPFEVRMIQLDRAERYPGAGGYASLVDHFSTAPLWAAWAVIAVLVRRGARRAALLTAGAVIAVQVPIALYGTTDPDRGWAATHAYANVSLPLGLLVILSLAASPGPAQGARLLGRRAVAGVLALNGAAAFVTTYLVLLPSVPSPTAGTPRPEGTAWSHVIEIWSAAVWTVVVGAAVLVAGALWRSGAGRRAVVLLALPGAPPVLQYAGPHLSDFYFQNPSEVVVAGLTAAGVALAAVRLAEIPGRRRARP
ncbi:hypothetical protein [Actinomadura parmotrematis]|uniref:DUF2079 domain-containing protein n=1 Tax=Actinomadura parmotrematis TaxID=2864039 RepID=A0ABS7FWU1_9ACTN|nr:hypothetical protein [Actinomadura parmotrematis]MBW8484896.1 hypothetical protein [Actinomadura parmotrematis]